MCFLFANCSTFRQVSGHIASVAPILKVAEQMLLYVEGPWTEDKGEEKNLAIGNPKAQFTSF